MEVRQITPKSLQKFKLNLLLPLKYAKKDDLILYLGWNDFKSMERYIKDKEGKFTLVHFKKQILNDLILLGNRIETFVE